MTHGARSDALFAPSTRRGRHRRSEGDRGQISLMILGFFVILIMLVLAGVPVTQIQLTRVAMLDAADASALRASEALDVKAAYGRGLHGTVLLNDSTVQQAAAASIAAQHRPNGVQSWGLVAGTGTPDGQTAVVRLTATDAVPIVGPVLSVFGGRVQITVGPERARTSIAEARGVLA